MSIAIQLGVMMFLQYAIWGAWFAVLSAYLESDLGFTGVQIGAIYSLLPLGLIIAPFIGGQLADRYFASERIIGVLQLAGGVVLLALEAFVIPGFGIAGFLGIALSLGGLFFTFASGALTMSDAMA